MTEKRDGKREPKLRFPEFEVEWDVVKLEEIADVKGGKRIPKGHLLQEERNDFPYITVSDIGGGTVRLESIRYVPLEVVDSIKNYRIRTSDIFISVAGTLGLVGRVPEKLDNANLTENANKLTNLKCDQKYLLQYLQTGHLDKLIQSVKTTNAQPKLAIYAIKGFAVGLASKPEQQKIASFLSVVDQKIQQLTRKKKLLEQYKKGVMQKIFSREIRFRDENGKDYPDWENKKLGQYLQEYVERVPASTKIPILTSSRKGLFAQSDYFDSRELRNDGEYGVVPKGYFTYRHMSDDSTFKFNINQICEKGAVSKEYPVFTTKDMDSYFLYLVLNFGNDFKKFAIMQKRGGTRTRLYFNTLKQLALYLPTLPEQRKIASFLSNIDKKIESVQTQLTQTQTFKKGLLQQMFV